MKDTIYIILDRRGITGTRKSKPSLERSQVAVKVDIVVPDTYFRPNPMPNATINLPEPPQLSEGDIVVEFDPSVIEPSPTLPQDAEQEGNQ